MSPSLIYWSVSNISVNVFKVQFSHPHLKFYCSIKGLLYFKIKSILRKTTLLSRMTVVSVCSELLFLALEIEVVPVCVAAQVKSGNELDTSISLHVTGIIKPVTAHCGPQARLSDVKPAGVCCRFSWQLKVTRDWQLTWQNSWTSTVWHNRPLGGARHQNPSVTRSCKPLVHNVGLTQDAQCPSYCDEEGERSPPLRLIRVNDCAKPII